MKDLVEPLPPTDAAQDQARLDLDNKKEDAPRNRSSAKINELIHLLQLTPSDEKSVVFSQFTSFLDKVKCDGLVLGREYNFTVTDC